MRTRREMCSVPIKAAMVVAGTCITVALAADLAHASGIGVRGAWVDTPDTEDNTSMVGGFVRLGSTVALEGAVDYRREDVGLGAELRTWPVTLSLILAPIPVVYGVAGVGWYNTTLELPPALEGLEDTQSEFGYHVGAGAQLPIVPALSFVGDLRYSYINYDFDEFGEAVSNFDGGNYLALNLGLMLNFQ
jgi:opacity protein-like surface antigen